MQKFQEKKKEFIEKIAVEISLDGVHWIRFDEKENNLGMNLPYYQQEETNEGSYGLSRKTTLPHMRLRLWEYLGCFEEATIDRPAHSRDLSHWPDTAQVSKN